MKVLIIEDVSLFQKLLERLIGDEAQCHSYSNGQDGLRAFVEADKSEEPFDVIFLDIMMPGMSGLEVLRKIRAIDPDSQKVKIIMATSISDAENVRKAIAYGCDGYITKPYNKEDIMNQLRKLKLI